MITFSNEIKEGDVIALGDIHGSWDLFHQFLAWVEGSGASVILLGDLIDRGSNDMAVLNATHSLLLDPESWGLHSFSALRGNHEQMFIDAASGNRGSIKHWVSNGGSAKDLKEMTQNHLEWVKELPIFMVVGETLFIHGGVFPGENPHDTLKKQGGTEELIWMRNPFLLAGPKLSRWTSKISRVVHGHTITLYERDYEELGEPIVKKDRVNIDTGAFLPEGFLTAYNATQNTFNQFQR